MVKTLRITSVIAVLMAMAIFALPVKYGVKTDQNVENYLNGPGVTDVFRAALGSRPATPVNQVHPLVQQAEAFALILNPPKPVAPIKNPNSGTKPVFVAPTPVTPKFNLICTIYYPFNPEMSQALIQEGSRRLWVKQSSEFNHLLIEQVKDGVVIVRNGEETFELKTPEKKFAGSIPILPASSGRITSPTPSTGRSTPVGSSPVRPPRTPPTTSKTTVVPKTISDEGPMAGFEELKAKIEMLNDENNSEGSSMTMEEKAVEMQKLLIEFKNGKMNISDEESQKLDDLDNYLDYLQDTSLEK